MGDLSLNGLSGDRPLHEDDSSVAPRQGRTAMGELPYRQLHYAIFSRSSASSRWGLARPFESFIPWPIRNFSACSLPALKSATDFSFSEMTLWTIVANS